MHYFFSVEKDVKPMPPSVAKDVAAAVCCMNDLRFICLMF